MAERQVEFRPQNIPVDGAVPLQLFDGLLNDFYIRCWHGQCIRTSGGGGKPKRPSLVCFSSITHASGVRTIASQHKSTLEQDTREKTKNRKRYEKIYKKKRRK